MQKPYWLNKKVSLSSCQRLKRILRDLKLNTVCEAALCPNISECFSLSVATFLILGNICTRKCIFCGVNKGLPFKVDPDEPRRIQQAVKKLKLNYIVITSPCRDDLSDGGVDAYCRTIQAILSLDSNKKIEVLIPDFLGKVEALKKIAESGAEIIAHNLETAPSLYIKVRNKSDYRRSLKVLAVVKKINAKLLTKSGLMLGLGEKDEEIVKVLKDLRTASCDFLTLGQYLAPSLSHYQLQEYIHPDKFNYFKNYALKLGFRGVKSSPYVRSSYLACSFMKSLKNPLIHR